MWLSKKLQGRTLGRATALEDRYSAAPAGQEAVSAWRMSAPWGIVWNPPDLAGAFFLQGEAGRICVGAKMEEKNLEAGELLLFSAGGARIYLKNNGEVEINGQIFSADQKS